MNDEELFDVLYEYADTVIEIKDVNPEEEYRKEVFDIINGHLKAFLIQVDSRLESCIDKDEENMVKETTWNFLVFALKKMIVKLDCPDENIEFIADHLRDQIMQCKRLRK